MVEYELWTDFFRIYECVFLASFYNIFIGEDGVALDAVGPVVKPIA